MKCSQLDTGKMAEAYRRAEDAAAEAGAPEVTMEHLAPHLEGTGSSCGACPALLVVAQKAFFGQDASAQNAQDLNRDAPFQLPAAEQDNGLKAVVADPQVEAERAHAKGPDAQESTMSMVRSALAEALPIPGRGGWG